MSGVCTGYHTGPALCNQKHVRASVTAKIHIQWILWNVCKPTVDHISPPSEQWLCVDNEMPKIHGEKMTN